MSKLLKKLTFSFLTFTIFFSAFFPNFFAVNAARGNPPPPTPAPSPAASTAPTWYNTSFKDFYGKVFDTKNPSDIFGERYTAAQVQWVVYGLGAFLINVPFTGNAAAQNAINCFLSSSIDVNACMDAFAQAIASEPKPAYVAARPEDNKNLFQLVFATDRPLSGISFVKEKVQNFSLVPSANAQTVGFGFGALSSVQNMWRAFRDIAFGLFVLVAIIFAFMIMFRVKISPQIVISVQSALPKIITALVLVTFSYAIAGFLIDLMYVVIGLISLATSRMTIAGGNDPVVYFRMLTLGQPGGLTVQVSILGFALILCLAFMLPFLLILLAIAGIITLAFGPVSILVYLLLILIAIIVFLVFFWNIIRSWWSLLKALVNILLLTIFAPIQIAAGVLIPNFGFGQWVKSYVSNLSVFVVTGVLYLFSLAFLEMGVVHGIQGIASSAAARGIILSILAPFLMGPSSLLGNLGTPPSPYWPPLLGIGGEIGTGLIFMGVSFVLFTLTPKATEIIQGLLSGRPFAYGTAIGEAFGPIAGPVGGLGKTVGGYATGAGVGYGAGRLNNYIQNNEKISKGFKDQAALFFEAAQKGKRPMPGPGERES